MELRPCQYGISDVGKVIYNQSSNLVLLLNILSASYIEDGVQDEPNKVYLPFTYSLKWFCESIYHLLDIVQITHKKLTMLL